MPASKLRSSRHKAILLVGVAVSVHAARFITKEKGHGSAVGKGECVVARWLRTDRLARDMLAMNASTFETLLHELTQHGHLSKTRNMSRQEKLAIFLYISRFAATTRQAADIFGRSGVTVGNAFKEVLRALLVPDVFSAHVYVPSTGAPVPSRIKDDPGLHPFFRHVIGAIDGTHMPAHPPTSDKDPFWTRKGTCAFNILAACDFEMCFIYVLSGWEGSASDSHLWQKALCGGLKLPDRKLLLGDAGFPVHTHLLVPYRGVRYHLKEYSTGTNKIMNAKELYNRRHSGARSVIERTFGVLQARFKILKTGCYYDIQTQADTFSALAVVHNIIRRLDPAADTTHLDTIAVVEDGNHSSAPTSASVEQARALAKRDHIAERMWTQYNS